MSFWEHLLCKTVIIQHNVVAAETYNSLNEIKIGGVLLIKKRILWIREIRPVLGMAILNKEKSSKSVHRYLLLKHKTISAKWTHIILKWEQSPAPPFRFQTYLLRWRWCVEAGWSSWLFKFRGSRTMRCSRLQLVALYISRVMDRSRQTYIIAIEQYN